MKKIILSIVAIAAIAAMPSRMMAQATENTDAAANIVTPLTLVETQSLHFGTMSALTATGGTCVLATDGTRTSTSGVSLSTANPASHCASYNVSGAPAVGYSITLPASFTVSNGTKTMSIAPVAKAASASANGTTGTLDGTGKDVISVGGTLTVDAGQETGLYQGNFNVTVAYN
ncbi:DUF4402 domain-containing protein [uncultured Bacteroides sp.]|uniref:DUF4402 domain-containing protein n=1 Tax=uncultured Bacteroides sp. TaxID=162156 RepID=UPI002AAB0934|nr:DUF4402 domain-containing protein [uncultured Bacteroides sp.]